MTRSQWITRLRLSQRKQTDVQRLTLRMTHNELDELLMLIEKEAETEQWKWQQQIKENQQRRKMQRV